MNIKAIASILIIALLTFTTLVYAVPWILSIFTHGTIKSAYELTATPSSIDWGNVTLNTPFSRLVDITNVGTINITKLTMTYNNSSPNLMAYTLTWNCTDIALPVDDYVTANFTLTIITAEAGPFSFDIWIGDNV
jgi:hypothetical protein